MFYSNLTYALISVYLLYKLSKKDFNLFHAFIFLLPFHSWMYNIGLNLTIYQIVTIAMMSMTIILSNYRKQNIFYIGNKYIKAFLLFAILDTIFISVFLIEDYMIVGGFFRSEGRFISQIILIIITFSIIPLSFNYLNNIQDVQNYLKKYLHALIVLTVLGWVQFFTYSIKGFDLFPLAIDQFGNAKFGMHGYNQIMIFRMSSLGGEPKGFSMSLTIGFFIIHTFNRYNINFFKNDVILKYLFLFTAFATLSTSGMVLFVILMFVYILYNAVKSKKVFKPIKNIYSLLPIFIIGLLVIRYWDFLSAIIEERVFERDIAHEDYDAPIQIFLSKFPEYLFFGSGLGNIHNLAYPYIPYELKYYMDNTIFLAKSGYLRIISELGLIGFTLFTYMFYSTYQNIGKIGKNISIPNREIIKAIQLMLIIILIAYFARSYLIGELILFLAIANVIAFSKEIRQEVG